MQTDRSLRYGIKITFSTKNRLDYHLDKSRKKSETLSKLHEQLAMLKMVNFSSNDYVNFEKSLKYLKNDDIRDNSEQEIVETHESPT